MNTYHSSHTAAYAAQAQTMRNQFIAQFLHSIFTAPSFAKFTAFWRQEQKSAKPCVG